MNGGNTNYLLTIPIMTLPGRGLNLALSLFYNSQVWTTQGTSLVFDTDDWPAAGWSLSLGKITGLTTNRGALQDADGTLHPYAATYYKANNGIWRLSAHTTDGSLIDYTAGVAAQNGPVTAIAQYPDGTAVLYEAMRGATLYATRIRDANGNFISVSSVIIRDRKSRVSRIQIGRTVEFEYDSNEHLTAIVAPGLAATKRTVVRLHYMPFTLVHLSGHNIVAPRNPLYMIDGIYFPGRSTGYWFGDSDSY